MIQNKQDLQYYLLEDRKSLGYKKTKPSHFGDEIWKFQIALRKHEYYRNTANSVFRKFIMKYYQFKHHKLGLKLGFTVPVNVCGPGLKINHYGLLIINSKCKIGKNFDVHMGVNIGVAEGGGNAPIIGDDCYIGPGAKVFGDIEIADNIAIGANSVVNKSFIEKDVTIVGAPAKVIKDVGTTSMKTAKDSN